MTKIQDTFKELLKRTVAPKLRESISSGRWGVYCGSETGCSMSCKDLMLSGPVVVDFPGGAGGGDRGTASELFREILPVS